MRSRKGKQTLPAAQQDHPRDKLGDGDGHDVDDHDVDNHDVGDHDVDDHDGRILAARGTLGLSR